MVEAEVKALRGSGFRAKLFAAHTDQLEGHLLYPVRAAYRVTTGRGRSPLAALRAWRPDIVHVHNLFPNFGRRWVEDLDVPLVHTLHNYRPLCAAATLFREGDICTLCPDGNKWAGVRHGCYRDSRLATLPSAWGNRKGAAQDPLLHRADRLVVLSERSRQLFEEAGVDPAKMVVCPNFLPNDLDPGPQDAKSRDGWLFVGRLSEEKGILRLLGHWPEDHLLRVVGEGQQREQIEAAARGKQVELLGWRTRREVIELMGRSQGLVFPSLCYETFGLVYIEALAAGLPVLAFEPNIVADHVRRDRTGWVGNFESLREDLMLAMDEITRLMRQHVRGVFEVTYSQDAAMARIRQVYGELIGEKPGRQRNMGRRRRKQIRP